MPRHRTKNPKRTTDEHAALVLDQRKEQSRCTGVRAADLLPLAKEPEDQENWAWSWALGGETT